MQRPIDAEQKEVCEHVPEHGRCVQNYNGKSNGVMSFLYNTLDRHGPVAVIAFFLVWQLTQGFSTQLDKLTKAIEGLSNMVTKQTTMLENLSK